MTIVTGDTVTCDVNCGHCPCVWFGELHSGLVVNSWLSHGHHMHRKCTLENEKKSRVLIAIVKRDTDFLVMRDMDFLVRCFSN